jgi:hypothetical protein
MSGLCHALPLVRETPTVYRPRRPERTAFYRMVMDHFDRFAHRHEEYFEAKDGPLRPVVRKVVAQYLDCGLLENGFARVRCPKCRTEYFCALTCRSNCTSSVQRDSPLASEGFSGSSYRYRPTSSIRTARTPSRPSARRIFTVARQTPSFLAVSVSVSRPASRSRAYRVFSR